MQPLSLCVICEQAMTVVCVFVADGNTIVVAGCVRYLEWLCLSSLPVN